MKVLFLITGLGIGGAERQVVDIADALSRQGHEVAICYLTGPALTIPNSKAIDIIGLQIKKSVSGFIKAYFDVRRIIRSFSPDVVHSHMFHANILARLVRLSIRIPRLICTAHSTNEGGKLRMFAYRATARLSDVTTNVSAEAVLAFEAKGAVAPGSMLAVSNGIDTERFRSSVAARRALRSKNGVDENTKIIVSIGRLVKEKDYFNLLRAYSFVLKNDICTQLWIIGDGDLKSALVRESAKIGISDHVHFFGIQRNVEDWLNAADIFVLSSEWEGFGLVVAEAMACEKVVVATNAGGVSEVLGDTGFIVPIRDSIALAEALKKALELDPDEARSLGKRARERVVEFYSLDRAVMRWLEIYKNRI